MTPEIKLYQAVKRGHVGDATSALAEGANLHQVRIHGKTAFRTAAEHGSRELCELLAAAGANVNEVGGARRYALLHSAAASSNFGMASILLSLDADPSPRASNDATPLHFAARSGQEYLAIKLLERGATVDAQDNQGRSPLHLAAEKGDAAMIELLLNHGCYVNLLDRKHRTALSIATANEANKLKELLIGHGAKANVRPPAKQHGRGI